MNKKEKKKKKIIEPYFQMKRIYDTLMNIEINIKKLYYQVAPRLTKKEKEFEYFKRNYIKILDKHRLIK